MTTRRPIYLDADTAEKIAIDVLKDHYPLLTYEGSNKLDKKYYKKLRKAFKLIINYYGEELPNPEWGTLL